MLRVAILSLVIMSATSAFAIDKVIYGNDNRVDVYACPDQLHVGLAQSTAGMIPPANLRQDDAGNYVITASLFSEMGMCPEERFTNQPLTAVCSGFLVGKDLIVTAGHCIEDQAGCDQYLWAFDYKMSDETSPILLSKDNVYHCKSIVERQLNNEFDYALIRLDREVSDRHPLEFRKTGKVANKANLVVIGHPSGLPTKISDGAYVRRNTSKGYFSANLDTYGGNSGSAVFDSKTGVVEGILVRGENDFTYDSARSCRISNRCTNEGCRGEDVTRITVIKALVRETEI
jgi:V8-like Glu-specific endopeptidase